MKEVLTIKEIMENKDLAEYIAEDIEDIPEDCAVTYAVWAIGYDEDDAITDAEMLIAEFTDPDEAIQKAKQLTLADIVHQAADEDDGRESITNVCRISIEVETVVEDDDEGTMNIGTIYKRDIWIDGERSDESDTSSEDEYSEVVRVTSKDYRILEDDGSLEIDCDILKNFNKNDIVQIWFTDEDNKSILTYKIISKTTGNKFICEFIY